MTAVDLVARVRGGVVGGTGQDLVIFCGSGATAAVAKLVGLLELAGPPVPAGPRPVVFVGPYEHHSNLLPWRETTRPPPPYLPIQMAASAPGAGDHKDAVFFSPHKFIGGPQTPGVWSCAGTWSPGGSPPCPAAARSPSSTRSASATWTTRWPGRRAAPRESSSRSGPGWSWPSSRPSGPT